MATYQHPASLNPWQQFGQACAILRNTTRASNPAWYQEALELNLQLHIRADGASISTFYHDRKKAQWTTGPSLTSETLHDPAKLEPVVAEALRYARSNGATSLGVILHIADEFATTELKPELDNPAALPELRETVVLDPGSILEDSSIQADQASWRVMPYPAAGSEVIGTVIAISRQYAPFLNALRAAGEAGNFPVITHALSAPLVTLMGLGQTINPTPGKPFVAILQYPWFITLAFFNERADLRFIRTLQHRGLRRPTNFRNALATTNASLEFIDPDLFLVPLGNSVDTTLAADLRITFTTSRVEVVEPVKHEVLPAWSPEPIQACQLLEAGTPLIDSHTFTALREEKWVLQNFLPTPKDIVEIYPDRSEMKLLRMLRLGRVALFAVTLLCITYFGFGIVGLIRRPEWSFNPLQAEAAQGRLTKLTTERQKADHWNNLLEDRSKAWAVMESFSRMFPENSGMLVKTYIHNAKADSGAGQAKVGFVKEWKITGYARDEAVEYLANTINSREGIAAHFNEIARITGNSAYSPAVGNRALVVNVRTQENGSYKSVPPEEASPTDESTYPFSFDLTISQRFEATDPMAITVSKAP
ncbi:MAG: hypothetical protein EOP88_10860 [Verrucomicrobiaceae bacterium]|nr:MAG: hypothetical protein EOP88_10860 [Verrucomicrobiaceae bacterium]